MATTEELLPECVWRDTLALLSGAFQRCGFDAARVDGLMAHATVIGEDAEGWGLLDPEIRGTTAPITARELTQGIVNSIQSDIYTAADEYSEPGVRLSIYAAAETWAAAVMAALRDASQ